MHINDRNLQAARHRLSGLALTQGRYFTAKQAATVGYGKRHLEYRVRFGSFERVERGLFRLLTVPRSSHDDLIRLSSRIAEEGLSYFEWYEDTCRRYSPMLLEIAQDQMALPEATTLQELSHRLDFYFTAARDCMPYALSIFPLQGILAAQLGHAVRPLLSGSPLS